MEAQRAALQRRDACKMFVQWVQSKLLDEPPKADGSSPPPRLVGILIHRSDVLSLIISYMKPFQPLIDALKRYAFTEAKFELLDEKVFLNLLLPLGFKRSKKVSHDITFPPLFLPSKPIISSTIEFSPYLVINIHSIVYNFGDELHQIINNRFCYAKALL